MLHYQSIFLGKARVVGLSEIKTQVSKVFLTKMDRPKRVLIVNYLPVEVTGAVCCP